MLRFRSAQERGHADHGWLDTWHSFSFANYYDPAHMGFRSLRVMNEDRVAPGGGFPTHGHRDMEIISYVLSGALEHRDDAGGAGVIQAGQWQHITAGSGVRHSEYNPSATDPVHFYQIWLTPRVAGLRPRYSQSTLSSAPGEMRLVASPEGRDGSFEIAQDAEVYLVGLGEQEVVHALRPGRHAWVQFTRGSGVVNGQPLNAGDGLAISEEAAVTLTGDAGAEALVFDLA